MACLNRVYLPPAYRHTMTELFFRGLCPNSILSSVSRKSMQTLKKECYRIIDVSSVDEAALRWNLKIFKKRDQIVTSMMPKNLIDYRAHSNVLRAILRLKYYQGTLFVSKKKK